MSFEARRRRMEKEEEEEEKKEEGDLRGQQAPKEPMTYARL